MPSIFAFGETVYDIIFENDQPVAARAGGAMLNSAVSLGRSGHDVTLLTELGADHTGRIILNFLQENKVGTDFIFPYPDSRTPVSLAFLDEHKSASYTFFRHYPDHRLEQPFPTPEAGDIILFGSFYSLGGEVHGKIAGFVRRAKQSGALVIYDPNIRKNHLAEVKELLPNLLENISLAGIVRGSEEDFMNLLGTSDHASVFEWIKEQGCFCLIITTEAGAFLYTPQHSLFAASKAVEIVSTIGAGDTFNAGIIHGLLKRSLRKRRLNELSRGEWLEVLLSGIDFAAECCGSLDNYISRELGLRLKA
jgi:fructokinase